MRRLLSAPARAAARVICIAAIILGASCDLGWAQPAGRDPSFEGMRAKLKAGDRVSVLLQNGTTLPGRFIDVGPDALSISTSAGDRRLSRSEVIVVQRHRRGIILGTIIGGGVGLVFGVGVGTILYNEGHDRDPALFGLTALGLGVGAGLDALINIPRTVYRLPPPRVTFSMEAGPRRTAVRVVLTF